MEYVWNIWQPTENEQACCKRLQQELSISEPSALLLVKRGISTGDEAREYIRPSLDQLHDPFDMKDMDKAVDRLKQALEQGERIMVYGDYDVDGTTAVALVYSILSRRTSNLEFYIPDRYTEGYGISYKGIDQAQADGCTLIVALDCGIKAIDKVRYAAERGIDFIICDHHTPGDELPKAKAVLNMKRHDCTYPYKELSGCGVGFKLMQALLKSEGKGMDELESVLPLLAMSIASDIVPMTGENRILAYYGLKRINEAPSVGVKSLLDVAGVSGTVNIHDLAYKLGPRINASGRLHSGEYAVRLLLADDETKAREMAEEINSFNTQRRDYDQKTTEEALAMLVQDPDNEKKTTTVVYSPNWHKGVVGIAASRLMETYYRPTIVLTASENGIISGSARSVSGFDLYAAIDSCRDLLTNFGGHIFAAGLSMREENLPEFKRRFEKYVAEHITDEQKHPSIAIEQEKNPRTRAFRSREPAPRFRHPQPNQQPLHQARRREGEAPQIRRNRPHHSHFRYRLRAGGHGFAHPKRQRSGHLLLP